ncbi:hypothetical protein [Portibacter marinus]|uniref:hypothetical protein n=1 Tax=Portibacter marinus TaxID=2898660 RepID=UPI001F15ACCC|nr:hypothetical protein [Portibacter marinus]
MSQLVVKLDKAFALSGEMVNLVVLSQDIASDHPVILFLRDNKGEIRQESLGYFQKGIAKFSTIIPSELEAGWYNFSAITFSNQNKIRQYANLSFPLYRPNSKIRGDLITIDQQIELDKCPFETPRMDGFLLSEPAYLSSLYNSLESEYQLISQGEVSENHRAYLHIETNNEQVYFGFFNPSIPEIVGLRKSMDSIYSFPIENIYLPFRGQVLGTDAFGRIKNYEADFVNLNFELPAVQNRGEVIAQDPIIDAYIAQHLKRLTIQVLYSQSFYQANDTNLIKADNQYNKADFIQFKSVQEFIEEVIPVVRYRKSTKEFEILNEEKKWFTDGALIIVDDVVTDEQTFLKSTDYQSFESIKIFRDKEKLKNAFGAFGRYGVMVITTDQYTSQFEVSGSGNNQMNIKFDAAEGPVFLSTSFSTSDLVSTLADQQCIFLNYITDEGCILELKKPTNP